VAVDLALPPRLPLPRRRRRRRSVVDDGGGREGAAGVHGGPARARLLPVPRPPGDGGAEGGAAGPLRRRRRHPVRAHPLARLRRPVPVAAAAARPQGDHRVLRPGRLILSSAARPQGDHRVLYAQDDGFFLLQLDLKEIIEFYAQDD
jgi:hypothetical protein